VYVRFRTHFNIILLVRSVNISFVALYCCSHLPVRTQVFLISTRVLIYIYIDYCIYRYICRMMMGRLDLKDEATTVLLKVDNNLSDVTV
jgi:hypothetical protein